MAAQACRNWSFRLFGKLDAVAEAGCGSNGVPFGDSLSQSVRGVPVVFRSRSIRPQVRRCEDAFSSIALTNNRRDPGGRELFSVSAVLRPQPRGAWVRWPTVADRRAGCADARDEARDDVGEVGVRVDDVELRGFDERGDRRPGSPPPSEPARRAFFQFRAIVRLGRSTMFASILRRPSSMKGLRPARELDGLITLRGHSLRWSATTARS